MHPDIVPFVEWLDEKYGNTFTISSDTSLAEEIKDDGS